MNSNQNSKILNLIKTKFITLRTEQETKQVDSTALTFQVDMASTPKKTLPRSSTPLPGKSKKGLKEKHCKHSKRTNKDKRLKTMPYKTIHSTLIDDLNPKIKINEKTKYPIKFYPNLKTQDINRIGFEEYCTADTFASNQVLYNYGYLNLIRTNKNFGIYGEYKVWLL
jgi:hypothetical protein